jgi:chemotaxis protein CheX
MRLGTVLSASSVDQIRIATDVFSIFMDMEVRPSKAPWPKHQRGMITSAVSFSKGWEGTMLIECDIPLAFMITKRMLGIEGPNAIDDNDVKDAMGELANMIGGNLKALMPPETSLSTPWVSNASGDGDNQLDGTRLTDIVLQIEGGKCRLSLVELCSRS